MSNASDMAVSTIPPFSTAPHASMTPGQPVPTVGILPERIRGTWYHGILARIQTATSGALGKQAQPLLAQLLRLLGESSLIHRSLGTQSFPRGLRDDEYYLFKLDDAAKGTVRLSDGTDIQPRRVQLEIASDRKTWDVWYHVVVEEGDGEKGYLVRDRALLRWVEYTGAGCDTEPAAGSGAEAERELSIGEQWRQRSLTRFSLANVGNQDECEYPNAKFKRLSGTEDPRECLFQEGLPTVHLKLLKVPDPQREIVENNVLLFEPDPEDLSRYLQTLPSAAAFGDTGSSSSTTGRVSFGSGLPASSLPTEPTAVPARRNKMGTVSVAHPRLQLRALWHPPFEPLKHGVVSSFASLPLLGSRGRDGGWYIHCCDRYPLVGYLGSPTASKPPAAPPPVFFISIMSSNGRASPEDEQLPTEGSGSPPASVRRVDPFQGNAAPAQSGSGASGLSLPSGLGASPSSPLDRFADEYNPSWHIFRMNGQQVTLSDGTVITPEMAIFIRDPDAPENQGDHSALYLVRNAETDSQALVGPPSGPAVTKQDVKGGFNASEQQLRDLDGEAGTHTLDSGSRSDCSSPASESVLQLGPPHSAAEDQPPHASRPATLAEIQATFNELISLRCQLSVASKLLEEGAEMLHDAVPLLSECAKPGIEVATQMGPTAAQYPQSRHLQQILQYRTQSEALKDSVQKASEASSLFGHGQQSFFAQSDELLGMVANHLYKHKADPPCLGGQQLSGRVSQASQGLQYPPELGPEEAIVIPYDPMTAASDRFWVPSFTSSIPGYHVIKDRAMFRSTSKGSERSFVLQHPNGGVTTRYVVTGENENTFASVIQARTIDAGEAVTAID
ncbi:hypothetical protein DB88DRAFT_470907 [Papiliotrema laurentii]|uniref:Uncharacterized protein n=1 Tax=Papiliotrema laurentii TaxID=5418 RepID=A0AAD9FUG2_PAPLA|nr:hypothetical protein DB88DRAFT_470907 [Papiliotrema laurentii]